MKRHLVPDYWHRTRSQQVGRRHQNSIEHRTGKRLPSILDALRHLAFKITGPPMTFQPCADMAGITAVIQ